MDRRLAAVLAADAVGFSAFAGRDEETAVRTLKGHLQALEPLVGMNGGRLVKSTGDGFLAEFPSVVNAVSCAATMQRRMAERNAAQPPAARMDFRMGVHVGDVVIDGDDILGDGVNVAARLQEVARPGGVVVSARVHEDVADKIDLAFSDLGEQRLKNLARPVRAWTVEAPGPAPAAAPAPERPGKPSVAVLAFDNLSSDAEQDYFADGITEDIITGLSRVPWLFVIARNSSFSYKGLAIDVRRIGRELGVRYVLEGSVRKAGARIRVTGQLIDAETGAHLWAERFDGQLDEVFELQDRITAAVVAAIAPTIRAAEIERAARKRPDSLDAYDHFLRALAAVNAFRITEADALLARAIVLSPGFTMAQALRAWLQTLIWHRDVQIEPDGIGRALALAEAVLAAPDADIEAAAYAGYVLAFLGGEAERGLPPVDRATQLCPNCLSALGSACILRAMRGEGERAIKLGEVALRLNPLDRMAYRVHLGMTIAHLSIGDYAGMLRAVEGARAFENTVILFRQYEIAALVLSGRDERARTRTEQLLRLVPTTRLSRLRDRLAAIRVYNPAIYAPYVAALARAGIPD